MVCATFGPLCFAVFPLIWKFTVRSCSVFDIGISHQHSARKTCSRIRAVTTNKQCMLKLSIYELHVVCISNQLKSLSWRYPVVVFLAEHPEVIHMVDQVLDPLRITGGTHCPLTSGHKTARNTNHSSQGERVTAACLHILIYQLDTASAAHRQNLHGGIKRAALSSDLVTVVRNNSFCDLFCCDLQAAVNGHLCQDDWKTKTISAKSDSATPNS